MHVVLSTEMNDVDSVDGNTMPQLMTRGAGNFICLLLYRFTEKNITF